MNGFGDRPKINWSDRSTPPPGTNDEDAAAWKDLGSSMNALSFGFVATAILVSMFLIMAIFEHLLRSRTSPPTSQSDGAQGTTMGMSQEQDQMHPKKTKNSEDVATSVLMPGQMYPTYIAQPAPLPCPREGVIWPSHDHHALASP